MILSRIFLNHKTVTLTQSTCTTRVLLQSNEAAVAAIPNISDMEMFKVLEAQARIVLKDRKTHELAKGDAVPNVL